GPGDPELITWKGRRILAAADSIPGKLGSTDEPRLVGAVVKSNERYERLAGHIAAEDQGVDAVELAGVDELAEALFRSVDVRDVKDRVPPRSGPALQPGHIGRELITRVGSRDMRGR